MTTLDTILVILLAFVFLCGWIISSLSLTDILNKNVDLQKENSLMVKRHISLQTELNSCKESLKKKKELIEIQDRLIKISK